MKRLFSFFGIFTLCLSLTCIHLPQTDAQTSTQQNIRQLILFWQDETVQGRGTYRPYTALELTAENNQMLWKGSSDARGEFDFSLSAKAIDVGISHIVTLQGYDSFGAKIPKADGSPDAITQILPAGLSNVGQSDPLAKISVFDADGKLITTTAADANGNYRINNVPRGAIVRFETAETSQELPFVEQTMPSVFLQDLEKTIDQIGENTVAVDENTQNSNVFLLTFLSIISIGGLGLGGYLFWNKKMHSDF